MMRKDAAGNDLGELDYGSNEKLSYEEVEEVGEKEHPCTVTMYEHGDFTGWQAVFGEQSARDRLAGLGSRPRSLFEAAHNRPHATH